ncbi:hypothetical protein [Naasia lichenicola]|uniref:Uncharacterized protein n=1 Tax=Naasia lichenicola TaxID=2565933 RepID=A0A4S4FIG0_9MICO|nr:hypothetical protein [Naasia lichenicola]THG29858.1 hypothetical protein E6C64_14495 [Naasia lichenicola]
MSLRTASPRPARTIVKDVSESSARHSRSAIAPRTVGRPGRIRSSQSRPIAAHGHLDTVEATQQKESTASVVFGLGGAFWLVLSLVKPMEAGPALFWTWLLLGAFLPGAAMLTALVTRLRTFRDMRIHHFLAMSIIGGMLARSLTLGAQEILTTAWPQLGRGWGWLFTDVFVNQTALVFTTLAFLGLLTGGQITVRRAMFVGGGIGTVFSSFELFRELMTATMAGEDTATMSVHILEHALLLPIDHPLWTSLLAGVIIYSRRVNTPQASLKRLRILLAVPVGQGLTTLVTEIVPGMAPGLRVACLAVAIAIGLTLFTAWRSVIRYSADEEKAPREYLTLYRRPGAHAVR